MSTIINNDTSIQIQNKRCNLENSLGHNARANILFCLCVFGTYFAAYFKISFIAENDSKAFGWQQRRASLPSR